MTTPATPATAAARTRKRAVEHPPATLPGIAAGNWPQPVRATPGEPVANDWPQAVKDHAAQLLDAASAASRYRACALCARVAITTTTTLPAARRALAVWEGPPHIRDGAIAILDAMAAGRDIRHLDTP